jgi:hypothetical protein
MDVMLQIGEYMLEHACRNDYNLLENEVADVVRFVRVDLSCK